MELAQSLFDFLINLKYIPNAKIVGTQSPTNCAPSLSPVKNNTSENSNEENAKSIRILSKSVNLFSILFNYLFLNINKNNPLLVKDLLNRFHKAKYILNYYFIKQGNLDVFYRYD